MERRVLKRRVPPGTEVIVGPSIHHLFLRGALAVVAAATLLSATASEAGTRGSSDPFGGVEKESQAARRAEARDRAEAVEQNADRTRERERSRLNVDDDATDLEDTDMDSRAE